MKNKKFNNSFLITPETRITIFWKPGKESKFVKVTTSDIDLTFDFLFIEVEKDTLIFWKTTNSECKLNVKFEDDADLLRLLEPINDLKWVIWKGIKNVN